MMALTASSLRCPEPRWATCRRPERRSFGPRLARIAAQLGKPFMPWQEQVALVGCELLENGRPAYRKVVISVPRQNGKTQLLLCWEIDRALFWGKRERVIYSAQTGRDAREKLLEDQFPLIADSPLAALVDRPVKTNGAEAILWRNGSRISVVASGESAGHGKTLGLGVIDEAFDDVDNRREQSLEPAMRTVRDAQLLIVSTMGTEQSLYFNQVVDAGRQVVDAGRDDSRLAYFEWSAPDDADPGDPDVWAACTPALGWTVELETIAAEYESHYAKGTLNEFQRFALNQRTSIDNRVIPAAVWQTVCNDAVELSGRLVFAVDCPPERNSAAVVAVDEHHNCELLAHEAGAAWLPGRTVEYAKRWGAAVAFDSHGPAGVFRDDFERAGVRLIDVSGRDFAQACGTLFAAVADGRIAVRSDRRLDDACAGLARRAAGDLFVWARRTSVSDISPFVALTIGYAAIDEPARPAVRVVSLADV